MKKYTVKGIAKLEITTVIEAETEEEALETAEEIDLSCSPLAFDTYYGLSHSQGELDYDGGIEWDVISEENCCEGEEEEE